MNREIEFRAKSKLTGQRVYGSLIIECDECYIYDINDNHPVDPETVGQFTGLIDKNGVKIFEGDICQYFKDDPLLVEWSQQDTQFQLKRLNGIKQYFREYLRFDCDVEVIGNIFESPELLEEK